MIFFFFLLHCIALAYEVLFIDCMLFVHIYPMNLHCICIWMLIIHAVHIPRCWKGNMNHDQSGVL